MAHRDDTDALRAQLEAQERDLRDARAELDVLRAAMHAHAAGHASSAAHDGETNGGVGMGFGPSHGESPRGAGMAPLQAQTQRRVGLLVLMISTLVAGLFLSTTTCPSSRRAAYRSYATPSTPAAPTWAPFVRSATVLDPGSPAVAEVGDACAVEVTPITGSSFDCRVVVRCGDLVLYGRGESGYNHCGPVPSLVRDENGTGRDGDPRLELDLASGTVAVEDNLGLGVQRVELQINPLLHLVE